MNLYKVSSDSDTLFRDALVIAPDRKAVLRWIARVQLGEDNHISITRLLSHRVRADGASIFSKAARAAIRAYSRRRRAHKGDA